ncbi:unnamed protein product [Dibothriocephalus latus]|uniref:Uncharacterized protein n=1 Tax=Dibothriocephalus latus TaxID=60516 RepID=A0A3P6PT84_DIBLA|nr:unnamed protein product [Dibothriocephalus latus]
MFPFAALRNCNEFNFCLVFPAFWYLQILHNERTTHYGTLVDTTFSVPTSLIAPTPVPEPRGEEPIDQTTQTKGAEVGSPPTIVSDDATSEFTAASPLLSHEQPTTTPGTPHVVAFQERTSIPNATSAEVPTTDLHVEDPLLRRLPGKPGRPYASMLISILPFFGSLQVSAGIC